MKSQNETIGAQVEQVGEHPGPVVRAVYIRVRVLPRSENPIWRRGMGITPEAW